MFVCPQTNDFKTEIYTTIGQEFKYKAQNQRFEKFSDVMIQMWTVWASLKFLINLGINYECEVCPKHKIHFIHFKSITWLSVNHT